MPVVDWENLYAFARESDKIEGIVDDIETHRHYVRLVSLILEIDHMTVGDLVTFNQNNGALRAMWGMDVYVGNHHPPPGGPKILHALEDIVNMANEEEDPYGVHHEFETLHPFMDGNGRTGRALWVWQMWHQHNYDVRLGFLHKWYYQSLDRGRS